MRQPSHPLKPSLVPGIFWESLEFSTGFQIAPTWSGNGPQSLRFLEFGIGQDFPRRLTAAGGGCAEGSEPRSTPRFAEALTDPRGDHAQPHILGTNIHFEPFFCLEDNSGPD